MFAFANGKCILISDIKSQQPCGSKNTASSSCGYNLRSRSYSASPSKSNPSTADPFDGRSSSQDNSSRCKLLVSSLRYHHGVVCDFLFKNSIVLSSLKSSFYANRVIDNLTKQSIGGTYDDAGKLMHIVSAYIEQGEGDINRYNVVMKCFNDQETLSDIVKKIKEYKGD